LFKARALSIQKSVDFDKILEKVHHPSKKDLDNRKERNSVIVSPQNILNIYAPDRYSFHKIYNSSGA